MNNNTICPCCRQHHFEYEDFYEACPICEWQDDLAQRDDPNYAGGANAISLNQYRTQWSKTVCPCCYQHHFEYDNNFETCLVCKWQDDGVQRDEPDLQGGANKLSLNQFRAQWWESQKS